jgi:hypothetical protein
LYLFDSWKFIESIILRVSLEKELVAPGGGLLEEVRFICLRERFYEKVAFFREFKCVGSVGGDVFSPLRVGLVGF